MNAAHVWGSTRKDLRRYLRDPLTFLIWIGIPLLIATLMSLAFGGQAGAPAPRVQLLLCDQDDSFLSRALSLGLGQGGPMQDLVELTEVQESDGRASMQAGGASALLVIPEGFGAAVLEQQPMVLELLTNPSQRILPSIAEELLSTLVDAVFYLQTLLGGTLSEIVEGPQSGDPFFPDARVADFSLQFNQIARRLEKQLFPPVIELNTSLEGDQGEERPGFGILIFTGMLFMSLIFLSQGLSGDVWQEHEQGTLRRSMCTPGGIAGFLTGKILAGSLFMAAVVLVGLSIGSWMFGLELRNAPLAFVWASLSGAVFLQLFYMLQLLAKGSRGGNAITSMVSFPLLMIGGSFFPFEAMPAGMAAIGRLTPNGWALEQFKGILFGHSSGASLALSAAGMVLFGLLVYAISLRRLRRQFL